MHSFIKKILILVYLQKIIWKFLKYFRNIHRNHLIRRNNFLQKQMLKSSRIELVHLKNLKDFNKNLGSVLKSLIGKINRNMNKMMMKIQNGLNLIQKNNQLNFLEMLWKMKAKFVNKQQKRRKKDYLCKRKKNVKLLKMRKIQLKNRKTKHKKKLIKKNYGKQKLWPL